MTKKEVLKWRLSEKPTAASVIDLINSGVITKEEGKEILFNAETEEDRDKKSLESEIKFLRELVDKLAKNNTSTIVETIRYIEKPYIQYYWYQPYQNWCGTVSGGTAGIATATYTGGITGTTSGAGSAGSVSFNSIRTF